MFGKYFVTLKCLSLCLLILIFLINLSTNTSILEEVKQYIDKEFGSLLSLVKDKELVEKSYKLIYDLMKNGNGGRGWKTIARFPGM